MKKTLLLLASVALLLVGCAKENFVEQLDGTMTEATFTAGIDGGVATKAVAYVDGNGAYANRCIMEIYYGDALYKRLVEPLTGEVGSLKATFANVPVVAGKQYKVLFWADHVDVVNTEAGLATDKYYTTKTTTDNKGLKAVTVNKTNFIDALKNKKNDELDAFFFAGNYTVPQNPTQPFNVSLKRPFAQLNVITTDVADGKTVTSADLLPDKVSVSYKAADVFNVATGAISSSKEDGSYTTYTYEADVYGTWSGEKTELTLSMDYLLASTEQGTVDVTFKTFNDGDENPVMNHSLSNLPYQRNYRTNVKGDLLTTGGNWKAEIDPNWGSNGDGGEINHIIASSYTEVVNALQSGNKSQNMKVSVTQAAVDNLSDAEKSQVIVNETIDGTSVKALKFVLYEEKKSGEQITQQASPKHVEFELPARPAGVAAWKIEYEPAYPTETVVVSTKEETDANVIIEAPKSTVTLEAAKINSVVSTTSENTLIIPQGLELTNLEVKKGAVEYHGTGLEKVTVSPIEGANVYFKTSEGLANTDAVYGVVKDHIAEGYAITKESETTWKIVPAVCKIGDIYYGSLDDAFKAVPATNDETTVTVFADSYETFTNCGATINANQKVVLDLNGKKLVGTSTANAYTCYICVNNGGELTVKDDVGGGGAIEYHDQYVESLSSGNVDGGSTIICHGCMTVLSGTIENKTPDTYTNSLEGAIDMYTNAWGQAYSPADIVLNINGGVIKSNNANTVRLTSFSSQTYTTSVTANMNGGEVYGRDGFFIQGVSESYLNTNTLNLNGGKVYGTQAVRVMAFQNHANTSESKPVTIRIREGIDMQSNYFAQSTKEHWNKGICIDNLSGTYEQLMSYVNIIDAAVCKIGETYYSTLDAAVTAAAPLAQIYLVDNCAENVTVAKNIELFTDGFEFTGKLNPAAGFYTFDSNDINNLGDFSSWYPEGMDYITLAYPSAEVHDIDCTGDPVVFNSKRLETAYSFNAFDTKITREDTGMTDMGLMTKVLGEPDFNKLNNFDFDAFGQAFEELTEPQKKRVNEIISTMLPYLSWIADFEVHFNKYVAEGSLGVSGYYGSYAEAEGSDLGMDIDAPMEIKVGDTYRMLYEYGFEIPYAGICLAVRTFDCGAYRIANDVAGTEMTVDLCLYNSNESSDVKKIVVGTYSYTFPEQQTE